MDIVFLLGCALLWAAMAGLVRGFETLEKPTGGKGMNAANGLNAASGANPPEGGRA